MDGVEADARVSGNIGWRRRATLLLQFTSRAKYAGKALTRAERCVHHAPAGGFESVEYGPDFFCAHLEHTNRFRDRVERQLGLVAGEQAIDDSSKIRAKHREPVLQYRSPRKPRPARSRCLARKGPLPSETVREPPLGDIVPRSKRGSWRS
jgi:hypothetical protein